MCTLEKRGNLFILTLTGSGDDHRLSPAVIASILSALSTVRSESTPGTALLTKASGSKFFSNGFDLVWARSSGDSNFRPRLHSMVESFRPVIAALISLPLPTVAALPGHAAAAGFLFALAHDYLVARSDRGVIYMSEVDLGLPFPDYFSVLMRAKIGDVAVRREVMLAGRKIRGEEAVAMRLAESAHAGAEKVIEEGTKLAERFADRKWKGDVYAEIRMSMFPEICQLLSIGENKAAAKL